MFFKTYEDEYRDCQEALLQLVNENIRFKAKIERKNEELKAALNHPYMMGGWISVQPIVRQALKDGE